MKKFMLLLSLLAVCASQAFALSLKEGFEQIKTTVNLKGVESGQFRDIAGGWISSLPVENAQVAYKADQQGNTQTTFYGSKISEVMDQLPRQEYLLGAQNWQNIIAFYAKPINAHQSQLLILIDMAYQGKTVAALCTVSNQVIEMLRSATIHFTPDHQILVQATIMTCN